MKTNPSLSSSDTSSEMSENFIFTRSTLIFRLYHQEVTMLIAATHTSAGTTPRPLDCRRARRNKLEG